jgi:aspartate racemase
MPRDGVLPLSFAQQRFWYAHLLEPESPAQNLPTALRFRGALEVPALQRALDEVLRRHEVLRTRFPSADGEPRQVVDPAAEMELRRVDLLTTNPPAEREAALVAAARAEAWAPFDLERGPLFRAMLARLDEEDHALVLTAHHVVFDGWSVGLLLDELSQLYAAFSADRPSPLAPLPVQYADYAHWQREHFAGDVLAAQLAYWHGKLEGVRPLELPTDRPRPAVQSYRGDAERLALSAELTERVRETSRREGVTLFMSLLAAYAVLLRHRSGEDDVVVGAPVATHRDREELQRVIGTFLNTLALRVDLSGDPTFRELLGRVRRTALEAYAHQELPFDRVVEALDPKRDPGRTPVFQVWFNHSAAPSGRLAFGDTRIEGVDLGDAAVKFDLQLATEEAGGRLLASLRYNADLFDAATAAGLLAGLEAVLARVAEAPGERLSALMTHLDGEARARRAKDWVEQGESLRKSLQGSRRKAISLPTT